MDWKKTRWDGLGLPLAIFNDFMLEWNKSAVAYFFPNISRPTATNSKIGSILIDGCDLRIEKLLSNVDKIVVYFV